MRSVGSDCVIDYTVEDFADSGKTYDLILGVVGRRSMFDFSHALSKGTYVMVCHGRGLGGSNLPAFVAGVMGHES